MHVCGQTVVNLIVQQVAALLTYQNELLNVAKLVFNASCQEFLLTRWNLMGWPTSTLVVFPGGRGAGLRFRGVSVLVIGQFCVRDREARGGRMVRPGGEFPVQPEGAEIRRILIAHSMRHKCVVRNGHKVFRGCAVGPAKREGIFTDRSFTLKSNVR